MINTDALKRDKRPQSAWVVHALIDRLEAAEKERDDAKAAAKNIALKLDYLRSKLETAENAQNDWLRANAPGGWIDNLRVENEAAEKERNDFAQQLVQSEIGKREISEAHSAVTRRLSVLADKNAALRAEVIYWKEQKEPGAAGWRAIAHKLRAKIERMEKQEPVWFIDERGEPKRYRKSKADYCKYGGLDLLYALPGAKGE